MLRSTLVASLAAILTVSGFAQTTQAQPTIANPSFEVPNLGGCPHSQYVPSGANWTFSSTSGITSAGCVNIWGAPEAISGTQVAFIQGSAQQTPQTLSATISQNVSGFLAGHRYVIVFLLPAVR
jgi:hypothetical protein